MERKRRSPLRILLAVALSGAAALVLCELILRAFPSLLPAEAELRLQWQSMESPDAHTVRHPTIGYLHTPNSERRVERSDLAFTYHTDGNGFRNPWPWPKHADLVAVGDSLTYSFGVDEDRLWTRLLADELGRDVINLGIDGAAPQQYLLTYEAFGAALTPKLVLFGLFPGNDARDTRLFDGWVAAGSQGNYAVWRHFGGRVPSARRGLKAVVESSYLLTGLRVLLEQEDYPSRTHTLQDGSRLRLAPGLIEASRATGPEQPVFLRIMETIEAARAAAERDGARFLVLLFPTKEEVYLPLLGETCPDAVGPFARGLEQAGVPYLDLTPALRTAAEPETEPYFFEIDGHPNAAGYAVIASAVALHLTRNAAALGLDR